MKAYDEQIRASLIRIKDREDARLDEEMKHIKPYVFSEEFERKMEAVMQVQMRRSKVYNRIRFAVAAVVAAFLLAGLLFIGSEDLRASDFGVGILEWMEEFFVIENNTNTGKDDEVGVLFDESRIGYLPDGFEKVEEYVSFSYVFYKYQNEVGDYISLKLHRNKIEAIIDNEKMGQEILMNEAGFEYRCVYNVDAEDSIVVWKDSKDIYYQLQSTLNKDEIIKIMNGISY